MPVPTARDPHPSYYVRSLSKDGRAAKIIIPPAIARQLGWCLRDLLVVELMPDNTLRVRKLELAPVQSAIETQRA